MTSATWPAPDLDDLAQAPEPLARAILLALCDDEQVEARALRYYERLLQFEADAAQGAGNGAGTPAVGDEVRSPTESNPKKRKKKTGDPRICVQCDCVFVEEENGYESCRYHAGKNASSRRRISSFAVNAAAVKIGIELLLTRRKRHH